MEHVYVRSGIRETVHCYTVWHMRKEINFVGIALTLIALIALTFLIDIEALKLWVEQSGPWAPIAFIVLKIATIVIAPLSGGPLYPIAGLLFGYWPATLYLAIGDFLGFTIAFWISRHFGQRIVQKMIADNEEGVFAKIIERLSDAKSLFLACLIFFPLPELISYATGLTTLRYRTFIVILFPIWMIASSLLIFLGAHLDFLSNFLNF